MASKIFEKSANFTEIVDLFKVAQFRKGPPLEKKCALALNRAAKIKPEQIERSGFSPLVANR